MFFDTADFPFTSMLEANWRVVRNELEALPRRNFSPFIGKSLYGQSQAGGQEETGKGWDTFGLYGFCKKIAQNCELCPETTKLVEAIPNMTMAGFSALEPGTHIKPHVGYTDAVLRCHLPLITPPGCALRVGTEVRNWEEGKCLVFDDTTEHEAWNRSDQVRVVLLIDFAKGNRRLTFAELAQSQRK